MMDHMSIIVLIHRNICFYLNLNIIFASKYLTVWWTRYIMMKIRNVFVRPWKTVNSTAAGNAQWQMHCNYCSQRQQIAAVGVSTEALHSESGSELCFELYRVQNLSKRVTWSLQYIEDNFTTGNAGQITPFHNCRWRSIVYARILLATDARSFASSGRNYQLFSTYAIFFVLWNWSTVDATYHDKIDTHICGVLCSSIDIEFKTQNVHLNFLSKFRGCFSLSLCKARQSWLPEHTWTGDRVGPHRQNWKSSGTAADQWFCDCCGRGNDPATQWCRRKSQPALFGSVDQLSRKAH